MSWFRIYGKLLGISVQTQLQYRASLVMQAVGYFILMGLEGVAMIGLFARFGSIRGWTMDQAAFLYGLGDMIFATADALSYGLDQISGLIKRGDFDRMLLRPCPAIVQVLGTEITIKRIGRFSVGLAFFAWGCGMSGFEPGVAAFFALAAAFVSGVIVFMSIFLIQAALTFRTVESLEVMNILTYGGKQVASYPMTAYRAFLRDLFLLVVPIGCAIYLPVCAALGREPFPGWPAWLGLLSPLACAPFAAAAMLAWRAGIKRYASTGS